MIISRTPVRLSFFGGGTDYPEYFERKNGAVLGTTIDKYIYITLNKGSPFFDHRIRLNYSKPEVVSSFEELEHPSVRETLRFLNIHERLDIHIFADLPSKTGLGSSSSFTVGFLNACYAYLGKSLGKSRLADEAIHIERNLIRENVGVQDQIHAAFGGLNIIRLRNGRKEVQPVIISPENKKSLESSVMLFYTGVTRFANDVVREQIENTRKLIVDKYLDRMYQQIDEAQDIVTSYSGEEMVSRFGALMHEGWELKKSLSQQISNPLLEKYYNLALKNGAIGGKLGGAGTGGFLILIAHKDKQPCIRAALSDLLEVQCKFEYSGTTIIYSHEPPNYLSNASPVEAPQS